VEHSPPQLTLVLEVHAEVGQPIEIGSAGVGRRRVVPIVGGTFNGHGELATIGGRVVPGGADAQLIQPDGLTIADAQYVLETERAQFIFVRNRGVRHAAPEIMQKLLAGQSVDPSLVYFRTTPVFETDAAELQVLTRSIFVGSGERYPKEVILKFWKVD
jgi:Protein of unknown function (DUF3237)